jgi:hypothetical protein
MILPQTGFLHEELQHNGNQTSDQIAVNSPFVSYVIVPARFRHDIYHPGRRFSIRNCSKAWDLSRVCEAANPQISDFSLIYPGEIIIIPSTQSSICSSDWVVSPNENLYGIVIACSVDMACFLAANPQVCDPTVIYPGETLSIPFSCSTASSSTATSL